MLCVGMNTVSMLSSFHCTRCQDLPVRFYQTLQRASLCEFDTVFHFLNFPCFAQGGFVRATCDKIAYFRGGTSQDAP